MSLSILELCGGGGGGGSPYDALSLMLKFNGMRNFEQKSRKRMSCVFEINPSISVDSDEFIKFEG